MKWFKRRLIYNRGYSIKTAENYSRSLKLLDEYLSKISFNKRGISKPEWITLKDIDGFIKLQRVKGKNVSTCNNYLAGIKIRLRRNLVLLKQVVDYRRIITAREPKKKIEALTYEETERLVNYFKTVMAKNKTEELIKTRNLVIIYILLYSGLRVNELSNLKISDVKQELQIIGKGWKRRVVYLQDEDLQLIDLYLYMRKDKSPYLLVSHSSNYESKKLSNVSIENIIREAWKKIGVKVFPHKLRHTFATNLLRNGAKLIHIQQLLGHSSITTTQGYLSVLNSELQDTQMLVKRF